MIRRFVHVGRAGHETEHQIEGTTAQREDPSHLAESNRIQRSVLRHRPDRGQQPIRERSTPRDVVVATVELSIAHRRSGSVGAPRVSSTFAIPTTISARMSGIGCKSPPQSITSCHFRTDKTSHALLGCLRTRLVFLVSRNSLPRRGVAVWLCQRTVACPEAGNRGLSRRRGAHREVMIDTVASAWPSFPVTRRELSP